jgi:hypothetical protein
MNEFTLKDFEAEWRTARKRMLNLKFVAFDPLPAEGLCADDM